MQSLVAVIGFLFSGTSPSWRVAPGAYADAPFDAVIVPGCPSEADGTVSRCQWERSAWAAAIVNAGSAREVIVSGGAVYTPHVEADAMAEALVAFGVPRERIHREALARHTDENAGYSLDMARDLGFDRLAVASEPVHAVLLDEMMLRWGVDVVAIPLDKKVVRSMLDRPIRPIRVAAEADWSPPPPRRGHRESSLHRYFTHALEPAGSHLPPSIHRRP